MKNLLITFVLAIGLTSCAAHDDKKNVEKSTRLLITYSAGSKGEILADASKRGIEVVYDLKNMNIIVLGVPEKNADNEISRLEKLDGVLAVKKDSSATTLQ